MSAYPTTILDDEGGETGMFVISAVVYPLKEVNLVDGWLSKGHSEVTSGRCTARLATAFGSNILPAVARVVWPVEWL